MFSIDEIKGIVVRTARSRPWGELLLDWSPGKAEFWDGLERTVPRRVRSDFKLWRRTCSIEADAIYGTYKGGDVLDIGSFHGVYSLILAPKAHTGAKFICFEPDSRAFSRLQYNLAVASRLFPGLIFTALPWVVGDGQGIEKTFPMGASGHPQYSSAEGGDGANKSLRGDECVELLGLRPQFIKIDVEGAELGVLRGLERTLSRYHPTLMLELHPLWQPHGSSVAQIVELLKSHGYESRDITVDETALRQLWIAA